MKYISTRSNISVSASEAIIKGLASDKGLFLPEELPQIDFNESFLANSYQDTARIIFKAFFDDFTDEEIDYVVNSAYSKTNFKEGPYKLKSCGAYTYLELFHGPTLAFKDMALTALPFLMEVAKKKLNINKRTVILTATSGDTGGAALSGFSKANDIEICVIYPDGGVSPYQEAQMLSFTNNKAHAFAYSGNFDDCQTLVKNIFNEYQDNDKVLLTSANSINIGRLVPQMVYYIQAYIDLCNEGTIKFGDYIDVCVPTGNFGNILACYIASILGLPINKFICASNQNDVLTEFLNTGVYNKNRVFVKTNSPSMDILVSSNLERLLYLLSDQVEVNRCMNLLSKEGKYEVSEDILEELNVFEAYSATEEYTLAMIRKEYAENNYIIDPHTAVARYAYERSSKKNMHHCLIASTASPNKFSDAINKALNINLNPIMPEVKTERKVITKEELVSFLLNPVVRVKVCATSANLGSGFDACGLALNLYNTYEAVRSEKLEFVNFDLKYANEDNLIIKSYNKALSDYNKEFIPIKLTEVERKIPFAGGLGSSAACIVCGVLLASYFGEITDSDYLFNKMVELEGHPDNVAPCYFGGMVSSYKTIDGYKAYKYPVNSELRFTVLHPDFELSTERARAVLPDALPYKDVTYDMSRLIHLPLALNTGDISLLKEVVKDKIHEPYRLPLITDGKTILESIGNNYACCVSGAGPSLLIIGKDYNCLSSLANLKLEAKWEAYQLTCPIEGAKMEVFK